MVYALQQAQRAIPTVAQQLVKRELQLLGVLREPLVGDETPDPDLATAATVPGTVTDITGVGGSNITVTVVSGGPGNGNRQITVDISATPVFTTVDVSGHYEVDGVQVVAEQGAAIPDAILGTEVATINLILAFLRNWGAIAT